MASPKKLESLIQQGLQLQKKGDLNGASRHFNKALSLNADHPNALWLAGVTELMRGKIPDGARHLEKLVRLQPNSPDAHHALGKARHALGRMEEAVACYRRALALSGDHVPSLTSLGGLLAGEGDNDAARDLLQHAVAGNPRFPEARMHLGMLLYRMGQLEDSTSHLEAAISLMPGNPEPVSALAHILVAERAWGKALTWTNRWTEIVPDHAAPWVLRGVVLMNEQKVDEALASFKKGQAIDPNDVGVLCGMCNTHRMKGDFEAAYAFIEPLLRETQPEVRVIKTYAAVASSVGKSEDAIRHVEEAIGREGVAPGDYRMLCFNAGELYDKAGDHDRAFEMYRQGNSVPTGNYQPDAFAAEVDAIIRVFGKKGFKSLPHTRHRIRRPILIVGMPRSGTTLLEQIIASHPRVAGAGECPDIMAMPGKLTRLSPSRTPFPDCVPELTGDDMDQLVQEYDQNLSRLAPEADRVTDKMPHNFMHLGLVELLLPDARVIHIQRDPIDTCLSNYFQDFSSPFLSYSNNLEHLGHHYKQYKRLMAHWRKVLSMPFMEVRYEDLVADQERVSREVIDFCGLEWDDACLSFHKTKRTVSTASYAQVRNPIYKKSVERWRRYEQHIGPLLDALGIKP